jgi:hypothetical protein
MTTETIDIAPAEQGLITVATENKLETSAATNLVAAFRPFAGQIETLIQQTKGVSTVKVARAVRLELRAVRVAIEKTRKAQKETALLYGRTVDGMAAFLEMQIRGPEQEMEAIEKADEIREAKRKAALKAEREAALSPYGIELSFFQLGDMPEETFAQLLENTKAAHEAKLAAARRAEEERIAVENARLKEEARMREENARLKAEAEAREAAARKEREAAEAALAAERAAAQKARAEAEAKARAEREAAAEVARKEREAREKVEAELKAREAADKARAESERIAAEKAAAAPDKAKLIGLADSIARIAAPTVTTPKARAIFSEATARRDALVKWLQVEAEKL